MLKIIYRKYGTIMREVIARVAVTDITIFSIGFVFQYVGF